MVLLKKYMGIGFIMFWIFLTYGFSSQTGKESSNLSRGISNKIIHFIKPLKSENTVNLQKFNRKLRKTAHFINYMLFSFIIFYNFKKLSIEKGVLITLLLVFLIACVDEFYQSFIPGREGRIKDVIIDFSGALLGMIFICMKRKDEFFKKNY